MSERLRPNRTPPRRFAPPGALKPDDHRRTCWCGHRFEDHSKVDLADYPKAAERGGTGRCLAASDEPGSGGFCQCHGWDPLDRALLATDGGTGR